ncbi:hypothetical protein GCK72_001257 [Caenorhabditis remanei]|uniref:Uncharacterized protein n=1 Tax=Caenorhabditis remanei TaxID=31234 RepID=A0A6A5HMI3_CAERE|nr:hypothetical protein GCK72_001257 [Caenorhabditis remanei]KAF1769440.1 hypothetical protein GCK72_001257 [Caenorhabditis remanei]
MSPNGTSSSSICCCSRYFRRSSTQPPPTNQQNNAHLEPIEIKVNGQPHLMVPHVAIRPTPSVQSIPLPLAPDNLSEINLELFETARTSRTNDSKLHPMGELIRMIRIEEGLEVTPRVESTIQPSTSSKLHQHLQHPNPMPTIPEVPKNTKPRKAVFNDEGDITTRSSTSQQKDIAPPVFSITNARKVSSESIGVPIITIPSTSSPPSRAIIRSSPISRRISATPQMITALVAYTYAFITTMLTTFTNIFSK